MSNNQAWKMESMKSFRRHIDPEMEERLKWTKIETEKKLKRTLKLVKSINQNKEGNAKKKAELSGIIDEISKEYKSMHDLYDGLTSDARRFFSSENENGSSSGYSSAGNSDMEFHTPKAPDTPISLASKDKKNGKKVKKAEQSNSDSEDALLKDKLTSSTEVIKKKADQDDEAESGMVFKDVEIEDAQLLSLEVKTAEVKSLEDKVKNLEAEINEMAAKNKTQTEENSEQLEQLSLLVEKLEQDKKGLQEELGKNMAIHEEGVKEMENQIMSAKSEAYKQRVENERLYARIFVLETTVKKRENESSALREKATELQNLCNKIQSLDEQHSFQQKIADQQKLLTEMDSEMNNVKEENKRLQNSLNEAKTNYQFAEKKVEEMSEEFFKKCEDQVRILSRRIRVAEQLHVESKEWYKKTKDSYEQQNRELKHRLRNITDISQTAENTLSCLESVAMKFDGCGSNFENRISKVSCELKFAKGWVARKNKAMANVRNDLNGLLLQLDDKESEILRYREKVWRSENRARELEKVVSEKEEGMMALQEEKREAIRQLCVWIDYHRSRSDYYKKILSDMSVSAGKKSR